MNECTEKDENSSVGGSRQTKSHFPDGQEREWNQHGSHQRAALVKTLIGSIFTEFDVVTSEIFLQFACPCRDSPHIYRQVSRKQRSRCIHPSSRTDRSTSKTKDAICSFQVFQ